MLGLGARAAAAEPRRVLRALVEDWPPYLEADGKGRMRGLDAELLEAIGAEAGYAVEWVREPAELRKRRYLEFMDDRFDVIFSATPVRANAEIAMYTAPYRSEVMKVAAAQPHDARLDSLRGFDDLLAHGIHLLHVQATGLGRDFEAHRERLAAAGLLIPYPTTRQGIEMLRIGRAPLILGDALDLGAQARLAGVTLVRQPYGHSAESVSLMLSRKRLNDGDLARIDRAIHALERRGALNAIRHRYERAQMS